MIKKIRLNVVAFFVTLIYTMMFHCVSAQTFTLSDSLKGFQYNSRGECLLVTDSLDLELCFSLSGEQISNCEVHKINFREEEDSTLVDSADVSAADFAYSEDGTKLVLKNLEMNRGYSISYQSLSCGEGKRCEAFVWLTYYMPIDSVSWLKDTVLCEVLELSISPAMVYRTQYGVQKKVNRTLSLHYNSYLNEDEANPKEAPVDVELMGNAFVELEQFPYVDTPFEIEDVTHKNVKGDKIVTDTFYTQAVVAYPFMETTAAFEHEGDEGSDSISYFVESQAEALSKMSQYRSSAPLTLNFVSNPNTMVNHYEWAIARGEEAQMGDFKGAFVLFEKEVNAYRVTEPDVYCIELTVSNIRNDEVCEHRSYNCFRIAESALSVPNTFTPNGDGTNDEFRVAYRSIASFEIYIYDQWGRKVYESNDITKGWDGYVGSKLGTIGTYFYVIKAEGTDGVNHDKKGTLNLLRTRD